MRKLEGLQSDEQQEKNDENGLESIKKRVESAIERVLSVCQAQRELIRYNREASESLKKRAERLFAGEGSRFPNLPVNAGWATIQQTLAKIEANAFGIESGTITQEEICSVFQEIMQNSPESLLTLGSSEALKRLESFVGKQSTEVPQKIAETRKNGESFFQAANDRLAEFEKMLENQTEGNDQEFIRKMDELRNLQPGFDNN